MIVRMANTERYLMGREGDFLTTAYFGFTSEEMIIFIISQGIWCAK